MIFLLILVSIEQVPISVEGRNLRGEKVKVRILGQETRNRAEKSRRVLQGEVDSFRPTNPGRSPGIGHSTHD